MAQMTRSGNNVGIQNPFALAELIKGKKISWKGKSVDAKSSIFEDTLGISYDGLFSSSGDSPLYSRKHMKRILDNTGIGRQYQKQKKM